MRIYAILLALSLLGIITLSLIEINSESFEKGVVSSVEYKGENIRINLEDGKHIVIFSSKLLNLKKGDSIEFLESKGSENGEELFVDKVWKAKS